MVDSRKPVRKKSAVMVGAAPARRGTLRFVLIMGGLILINLYVFLWKKGTSLPEVQKRAEAASLTKPNDVTRPPDAGVPLVGAPTPPPAAPQTITGKVGKGDSLGKLCKRVGLSSADTDEVIRALHDVLDFKALRVGQAFTIERAPDGRVTRFELIVSKTVRVSATRDASGELVGDKREDATRAEIDGLGGRVTGSLYAAVKAAGGETPLVGVFVDVFAYDLDFYQDSHDGDRFKVVVEKEFKDQEFLRYRRVLAAEYAGKAGNFRAFWWQAPGARAGAYYDDQGRALEKTLLKTPLKFATMSSGFDRKRMHPVLHTIKAHLGVDYAAPVGTPVWAAAAGVVESRGPAGNAGNMVVLRHDGGLETLYMHLSRFADKVKVGDHLEAKTVIGYVGTTGLSTGPHLHFGVKQGGAFVDPTQLAPARAAGIGKRDLAAFQAAIAPMVARLDRIAIADPAPQAALAAD
jgi:murein DD-endopeptidase MepM/ murein hydrolase activator NlpD